MIKNKKVAIVHDLLLEFGGSEKVLLYLLRIFPQADVYTFYYNEKNSQIKKFFSKYKIISSFFQKMPYLYKLGRFFSIFKIYSWQFFNKLDLSTYDLIISSSHSYNSKNLNKVKKNSLHLCYLHCLPKYLYSGLSELSFIHKFPINLFFYPLKLVLKYIDKEAAQKPDLIMANSLYTQKRIKEIYSRDSILVYPPIELPKNTKISINENYGDYYVAMSRLANNKGFELIINAFNQLNRKILIIGTGSKKNKLKRLAKSNIVFLDWVEAKKLKKIFTRAKALIHCSREEDFGLVIPEFLSYSRPVIAFAEGGIKEIIVNGKNGLLFDSYDVATLKDTIKKFEQLASSLDYENCLKSVKKFEFIEFKKKIDKILNMYFAKK